MNIISQTKDSVINKGLENSMDYSTYVELVNDLYKEGKSTTKGGADSLLEYTKLNISRMKRLNKTFQLTNDAIDMIKTINSPITWLVISEGWCGDAAQNLPIINAIAEQNNHIDLRIVLRDENPELMQAYLTNGNMAIPKLIQIENDKVTKTWGPRPTVARKMVADYKAEHGQLTPEFKKDLQIWYNQDKGLNTVDDLLNLLKF
jgi:hypothetical protein